MSVLGALMWIWTDKGFVACDSVPISDRGFRYGMSVFESMRVGVDGPEHLDAHLARLRLACGSREFPLAAGVLERAAELIQTRGGAVVRAGETEGFARIYVTAGDGAPTAAAEVCRVFVYIEARARPTRAAYDVTVFDETCLAPFGGIKTANYWVNLDMLQRAQRRSCDEALLFNVGAELMSACLANVFVVHGQRIRTPSTHCGARDGVMREWVMGRCPVEEGSLFVDDLRKADEIFLTNSWIGVMPVASFNGRTFDSRHFSGKLQSALRS